MHKKPIQFNQPPLIPAQPVKPFPPKSATPLIHWSHTALTLPTEPTTGSTGWCFFHPLQRAQHARFTAQPPAPWLTAPCGNQRTLSSVRARPPRRRRRKRRTATARGDWCRRHVLDQRTIHGAVGAGDSSERQCDGGACTRGSGSCSRSCCFS